MSKTKTYTNSAEIMAGYKRYYMLRINKGMTDREIADTVNISYNALINWRMGRAVPSIKNLYKLAQYFGTQVSYLIEGVHVDNAGIAQ